MKKRVITGALVLFMTLTVGTIVGCESATPKEDINANIPAGAPPLMPASHEGRFDNLGANGCYGCHGANDKANPMLNGAKIMPEDHYTDGTYNSQELDAARDLCNTCHVQG